MIMNSGAHTSIVRSVGRSTMIGDGYDDWAKIQKMLPAVIRTICLTDFVVASQRFFIFVFFFFFRCMWVQYEHL